MNKNLFPHFFRQSYEVLVTEREDRISRKDSVLPFGVNFLDECAGGITQNDFVILGARTGCGKTELVNHIALSNAYLGKRVHIFALEAEEREVERRSKFKILSSILSKEDPNKYMELNFQDWMSGKLDHLTCDTEMKVEVDYKTTFSNLHTLYRNSEFNVEDFEKILMTIKDETDLIIIDHLHYFDYDDPNEIRAIRGILKKLRDLALIVSKPIVLVAHLRKAQGRGLSITPEAEDFHGTSDISKIATKIIALAPALDRDDQDGRWPTYVRVLKCRSDGSRTRYVGLLCFNPRRNAYESNYVLGKLSYDGTDFEELQTSKIPKWAYSNANTRKEVRK